MYEIGQNVVYGIHGVCRIVCVEDKYIDKKTISYYVLEPLEQPGARYYLPSNNPNALAKIRPLMDAQTLQALLTSDTMEDAWIEDENRRKQYYREIINGVDSPSLIRMVHCLHQHKAQLAAAGRKFHMCDENFLRDAQRVLGGELSVVLNIPVGEVGPYIQNILESK